MKLLAYAKINLGLHVLARRPDGFHDLETVFHQINLFDEIEILPHNILEFSTESRDVPRDSSNLCLRAATLLQQRHRVSSGARIRLNKRIPVGAGLGGGSSDAAAVLKGLTRHWNLGLSPSILHDLAAQIGSDVPFFLEGGTSFATGRGDKLNAFKLRVPYWILVVTPPIHVSTAWAYSNLELSASGVNYDLRASLVRMMEDSRRGELLMNDFEPMVFSAHPEIRAIKESMLQEGARFALLSGSGSSVFGLFTEENRARAAAKPFPANHTISLTEPNFRPESH
ncbi:MAG: 4-(cytidine 5'-diphospho)-2-C-methyl-D-erythritol kinase [Bacteroidota bacterium]